MLNYFQNIMIVGIHTLLSSGLVQIVWLFKYAVKQTGSTCAVSLRRTDSSDIMTSQS